MMFIDAQWWVIEHGLELLVTFFGITATIMHSLLLSTATVDLRILRAMPRQARPSELRLVKSRVRSERMHLSKGVALIIAGIALLSQDIPEDASQAYWIPRIIGLLILAYIGFMLSLDAYITRRDLQDAEEEERKLGKLGKTQPWGDPERNGDMYEAGH